MDDHDVGRPQNLSAAAWHFMPSSVRRAVTQQPAVPPAGRSAALTLIVRTPRRLELKATTSTPRKRSVQLFIVLKSLAPKSGSGSNDEVERRGAAQTTN